MSQPTVIGVYLEARIDTWDIWSICPWPNVHFPFGFEFSFPALKVRKLEKCEFPEDNGMVVYNPDTTFEHVLVRVDDPERLPADAKSFMNDENELRVPFSKCESWLGVSHWKLIELLEEHGIVQLIDALAVRVMAREYVVVTLTMEGKVFHEKREPAPAH